MATRKISLLACIAMLQSMALNNRAAHIDWGKTFHDVIETIHRDSYFPVDVPAAMEKALDTLVHEIDEHARFLGPESLEELKTTTSGKFYGIGVELAPKKTHEKHILITRVVPGGPADKAGLKSADSIRVIQGGPIGNKPITDYIQQLRGKERFSPVNLEIARIVDGIEESHNFTVLRDSIPEECCWHTMLDNSILYCALVGFTKQSYVQLKSAIEQSLSKKPKGIILDLRENTGGLLQAAIDCASLFLPKKSLIVTTKNKAGRVLDEFRTGYDSIVSAIPIIILVNNNTASSAEILAQALRVHAEKNVQARRRQQQGMSSCVFILGSTTYGKGSIQEIRPIGQNCALQLTTAYYYLPDGSTTQDCGVVPDFITAGKSTGVESLRGDSLICQACDVLSFLDKSPKLHKSRKLALDALKQAVPH